jgi:hypothetical protein
MRLQVPVGRHQLDEDQKELGDKLCQHVLEMSHAFRWLLKRDAGWTDEEFNEVIAGTEKELHTKPGLLFSMYVTHARKA